MSDEAISVTDVTDAAEASIDASVQAADMISDAVVEATPAPLKPAATKVACAAKASRAKIAAETKSAIVKPTAKRRYVRRAKSLVAPVVEAVAKISPKASAKRVSRKTIRNTAAAATAASAPLIEGIKTMSYEFPNFFAGFTAVPGADKFQSLFAEAGEKGQDVVRKSQAFAEQLTEAAKANVEAVVESGRIAAAGARDLGQEVVASTRNGVEQASAAVKTLTEAKSPTEFFSLQSELVKSSFDRMVAEGSKFTEQMVKLTGEAIQPLSNRASVNAEKFTELTA